jgi:hypothetical protein
MLSLLPALLLAHDRLPLSDANNTDKKANTYDTALLITRFLAASYSLTPTNIQAQAKL